MAAEGEELPSDLLDEMTKLDKSIQNCDELLKKLTNQSLLDTKDKLEPVEKAKLDLTTTYAINSLFWIYLVTQGINATDHQVKGELERIKTYMSKIKDTEQKVKGATLKIDKEAAKRFVKSALWTEKDKSSVGKNEQLEQDSGKEQAKEGKRKGSEEHQKKKKKKKKLKQD